MLRALLGVVLGIVARLWLLTLRMTLEVHPDLARVKDVPWVLAFFHGTQWPLLAWPRRRPTVVMVSHSSDGQLQARALGLLGFLVVRGSSSRGGARALAGIVRRLRRGDVDAAFAVDGPRGPYGEVKPGAVLAASRSGGVLVPMGSAVRSGKTFSRAWDRFVLAWPFTRVTVVLGAPLTPEDAAATLGDAIRKANEQAEGRLATAGRKMLPLHGFSEMPPPAREVFRRN
jgi:lysophospholipid acyltransferase (LPLAT)-like uncharacterized protein